MKKLFLCALMLFCGCRATQKPPRLSDARPIKEVAISGGGCPEDFSVVESSIPVSGNQFGISVSASGDNFAVGENLADFNGTSSGLAHVYEFGQQAVVATIMSPAADAADLFGQAVAIDGDDLLVGAILDDEVGLNYGAVYWFHRDIDWFFEDNANGTESNEVFGAAVAMDGANDVAVVGAPEWGASKAGRAYVYTRSAGSWSLAHTLLPDDYVSNAVWRFGTSVAVDGDVVVVGAPRHWNNGSDAGAAYVFDVSTGDQVQKLNSSDSTGEQFFGRSVAIDGDLIVVGAFHADTNNGAVYVFNNSGGWNQGQKITNPGEAYDSFGVSVAISRGDILVGTEQANKAYRYEYGTSWTLTETYEPVGSGSNFGYTVSGDGGVVVGDWGEDNATEFFTECCEADLNEDTVVGASDLAILLGNWGACSNCPADFNDDGTVNAADLSVLLGNWGAC